jgi:hypothetical protein
MSTVEWQIVVPTGNSFRTYRGIRVVVKLRPSPIEIAWFIEGCLAESSSVDCDLDLAKKSASTWSISAFQWMSFGYRLRKRTGILSNRDGVLNDGFFNPHWLWRRSKCRDEFEENARGVGLNQKAFASLIGLRYLATHIRSVNRVCRIGQPQRDFTNGTCSLAA